MEIEQLLSTRTDKDGSVWFEVKWMNTWFDEKQLREKIRNKSHLIAQMLSLRRSCDDVLLQKAVASSHDDKPRDAAIMPDTENVKREPLDTDEFDDVTLYTCDICNGAFDTHADLRDHKTQCVDLSISSRKDSEQDGSVAVPLQNDTNDEQVDRVVVVLQIETNDEQGAGTSDSNEHDGGVAITIKTENDIFECENCHMTFADEEYLRRHKVRCKDHQNSNFRCEICNRGFTAKGSLELHVDSVHLKKKEFGCSICGKFFSRKHILKLHLDTHYGKRDFQCAYCGKTFLQKSNLNRHERIHEAKNFGYKCRFCGQAFTQNKHLQKHMDAIHSKTKST